MSMTDDSSAADRGSELTAQLGLVERLRFLASGQDDPHSLALTEAADEIGRLNAWVVAYYNGSRGALMRERESIARWLEGQGQPGYAHEVRHGAGA